MIPVRFPEHRLTTRFPTWNLKQFRTTPNRYLTDVTPDYWVFLYIYIYIPVYICIYIYIGLLWARSAVAFHGSGRVPVLNVCDQVLVTQYLVDTKSLLQRSRDHLPATEHLGGTKYLLQSTWDQVLATKYLVQVTWNQVPSTGYELLDVHWRKSSKYLWLWRKLTKLVEIGLWAK